MIQNSATLREIYAFVKNHFRDSIGFQIYCTNGKFDQFETNLSTFCIELSTRCDVTQELEGFLTLMLEWEKTNVEYVDDSIQFRLVIQNISNSLKNYPFGQITPLIKSLKTIIQNFELPHQLPDENLFPHFERICTFFNKFKDNMESCSKILLQCDYEEYEQNILTLLENTQTRIDAVINNFSQRKRLNQMRARLRGISLS